MIKLKGAAALFSDRDLGGPVDTFETNPTTILGAQEILPRNPERVAVVLYNLSASSIFVGFSGDVSASNGMLIPSNGGFMSMNVIDDYEVVTKSLYVHSGVAGNQLYILEVQRTSITQEV